VVRTQSNRLSFNAAVRVQIQKLREKHGWRQEKLAEKARQDWGLNWNRATVAAIEAGKRELSPVEFLLLRPLLELEGYEDLFQGDETIAITPEVRLTSELLYALFSPDATHEQILSTREFTESPAGIDEGMRIVGQLHLDSEKFPEDPVFWRKLKQDAAGDAEQNAARKFAVQPMVIAVAAHNLWNRSLSEERDVRALELFDHGENEEESPLEELHDKWSRRRLQALRGHATRELLRELEPILKRR
jgi:transcriptional regulator with XRE-family HTH domain